MSLKSANLTKKIQKIHQFILAQTEQDQFYQTVTQDLIKISDLLASQKLLFKIVSTKTENCQALINLLNTSKNLPNSCQFETALVPKKPVSLSPQVSAQLTWQNGSIQAEENGLNTYELPFNQKIAIGRNASLCQIKILDHLTMVSGYHAEIELVNNHLNNRLPQWQIIDHSRHGIYINGQKVINSQILQSEDIITLGGSRLEANNAQLCFQLIKHSQAPENQDIQELLNCDLFCLIIPAQQALTIDEEWLLQQVSQAQISQLAMIVELPENYEELAQTITTQVKNLETYFRHQYPSISFDICTLPLFAFAEEIETVKLELKLKKSVEQLIKIWENFARRPEDILTQRLEKQVDLKINQIGECLETKIQLLQQNIEQSTTEIEQLAQAELKLQMKKALKKASEQKDLFFKQVKNDLAQSKGYLLDLFRAKGLPNKIKTFTQNLTPKYREKGGYLYLTLQLENDDKCYKPDEIGINICHKELEKWGNLEWKNVVKSYQEGGLKALLQRNFELLNFITALNLPNYLFQTTQNFTVQSILKNSYYTEKFETKYKQPGLFGYLFKSLRGLIISGISTIMLLGAFLIDWIKQEWGDFNLKATLALILLIVIIPFTLISYHQEKEMKITEEADKLRKEINNYYQTFAKSLADKIIYNLNLTLEIEERQIQENLITIQEIYDEYLTKVEQNEQTVKSQIMVYSQEQKSLEKDLQSLKRI